MSFESETNRLYTQYKLPVFFAFVIAGISYAYPAVNLMFAGDDWHALITPRFQYETAVAMGRWAQVIFYVLSFDKSFMLPLTLILFITSIIICSVLILDLGKISNTFFATLVIGLWVTNPVWAEPMSFKILHIPFAFGLFSAVFGVYLAAKYRSGRNLFNKKIDIIAVFLIAFSASIYQPFILIAGMVMVLDIYLSVIVHKQISTWKSLLQRVLHWTVMILTAILLFVLGVYLVQALSGIELTSSGGYSMANSLPRNFQQFLPAFNRFGIYLGQFLFQQQHLWPLWTKVVLWMLIIMPLVHVSITPTKPGKKSLMLVVAILAVVSLLIIPFAIGLIRVPNSYKYNSLMGLAAVMPMLLVLQKKQITGKLSKFFFIPLFLTILTFVGSHNRAAVALKLLNQSDLSLTQRILSNLEHNDDFLRLASTRNNIEVVFSGRIKRTGKPFKYDKIFNYEKALPPMRSSIIRCGIYNCQLRRFGPAIRLISGYDLPQLHGVVWKMFASESLDNSSKAKYRHLLEQMPRWPHQNAIQVLDGIVFVKFGDIEE